MGQEIWVNLDAHACEGNACLFHQAFRGKRDLSHDNVGIEEKEREKK